MLKERWKLWEGEIPTIPHSELVDRAFAYLRHTEACGVVFKERRASTMEQPDAIGFKGGSLSVLIECKASRSDFLADKKKSFRGNPDQGMGYNRFMMAPIGMLAPDEMPHGWGLLEVYEKERGRRRIRMAKDSDSFFVRNTQNEVSYLVSSIRRIQISMAVFVEPEESL